MGPASQCPRCALGGSGAGRRIALLAEMSLIAPVFFTGAIVHNTRDFKNFTAMHLVKSIRENTQESRMYGMLQIFGRAGQANSNTTRYPFWQQHNHPIGLGGNWLTHNLDYIHNNPLKAKFVSEPKDYWYASARN